ncbi:ATG8-interacting protein 1-like isoform X2 [Punica granatum]|uniref:ATG8-interacting protein 1-like isoform X2 n=1 Tax=Punica granatum TaxID=22663 RepID=A0A6P8D9Q2_PUNGR|nr:ATG8-interacting protein 1-like isoform X2 [Punica granatum]
MADNEGFEESNARGNDWEVVSLTASTYAASPGPTEVELKDDIKGDTHNPDKAETSNAMFISGHFGFHPAQHDNLPLEISDIDVLEKQGGKDNIAFVDAAAQGRSSGKVEKDWVLKGLSVPDEFPGLHFLDEKSIGLSIHGSAFEDGKSNLQGLKNLTEKEQSFYSSAAFSSFQGDTALRAPPNYVEDISASEAVENMSVSETDETPNSPPDLSADISHQPKKIKGEKSGGFDLPCGAWWKRRAASFYAHAKEANAFWSVFVAAAVMGLVILGQRWQQEKWQVLQLRWHLSINSENGSKEMGSPLSEMKGVVSGQPCCSLIEGGSK